MPLHIVHQDISKIKCDVIVNPTDPDYSGSGGTDLAVHEAAGYLLGIECEMLKPIFEGDIAVTNAYDLPCSSIIHTVGPKWRGGNRNEYILLRSCYINALIKAHELGADSIAVPLISSGTYGIPKKKVLKIALETISDYLGLLENEPEIYLCVFDRESYELDEKTALDRWLRKNNCCEDSTVCYVAAPASCAREAAAAPDLDDWIKHHDDSFAVTLMKLIDKKGMTDVQCYKKANVSKGTFWKINNDSNYRPSKATVLAFAIALELTLSETEQLLKTVGFSLSHSSTFDLIIEFYITKGIYDIYEINSALYQYDQVCLGC